MRRRAALLALALLAAACGGDGGGAEASATSARDATSTSAPGAAPQVGTTGAPGTTPPPTGPVPTTAPSVAGGPGAPPTAAPPAAGRLAPGGVGDLAFALLRPGNGDRIVVELRTQAGADPGRRTVDHLTSVVRSASGKAVVADASAVDGGARAWPARSIAATADAAARHRQGGSQVVLRILFLRGTFEGDTSVLGVAVRGDVAAVFVDQVAAAATVLVPAATIEDAVTIHEVGHLLGLVDLAVDTGRDDPEHPGHSTNPRSVMHWAVESDLVTQVLGGGVPTDFDDADRADLARIRNG